jgi:hypothetical protein
MHTVLIWGYVDLPTFVALFLVDTNLILLMYFYYQSCDRNVPVQQGHWAGIYNVI